MATAQETSKTKANGAAQQIKAAAEAVAKTPKANLLTPSQAIGIFTESLPKEQSKLVKDLYDKLLEQFANESTSRIMIGKLLNQTRETLGENFGKFLQDCVVKVLRKSPATCYNYMALASAATLKFAKNPVVAKALFRIWAAEGAYDSVNGELRDVVDKAIGACGGIPESTDSSESETWVRKFVEAVDALVRGTRKAEPGGRRWDAETVTAKSAAIVKQFHAFITNKSVSSKKGIELLSDLMFEAMREMSKSSVESAIDRAVRRISELKTDIREHAESQKEVAA